MATVNFVQDSEEQEKQEQKCQEIVQPTHGKNMNDMDVSTMTEIMSTLDFSDAMSCTLTCKFMRSIYWDHRNVMPGPKCEVSGHYRKGRMGFLFQYYTEDNHGPIVSLTLDNWNKFFKNSICISFHLELDENLPEDLVDKIFCCRLIRNLTILGKTVNQRTIDKIDQLVTGSEICVEWWPTCFKPPRSTNKVKITGRDNDFKDIIKVLPNVEDLRMTMTLDSFRSTSNVLETLPQHHLQVRQWQITIYDEWNRKLSESLYNHFVTVASHIAKYPLEFQMIGCNILIKQKQSFGYEFWIRHRSRIERAREILEQLRMMYGIHPENPQYNPYQNPPLDLI